MSGLQTFLEFSAIMFFATAFRTTFGFGEALIAVPLLSLLFPIRVSAPVAVLASIFIAAFVALRNWRHIHFSAAGRLLLATILGIPVGLFILNHASESVTKATMGAFLLLFAAFSLHKPESFRLKDDRTIWIFGFLAGVSGGSYGMNGPPLAVYGAGRGWSGNQFRATLQAYFLPASCLGMVGYYFSGVWTLEVSTLFGQSLPAMILGVFVGEHAGKRIEGAKFARYLYQVLILVALILIFQAYGGRFARIQG